MVPVSDKVLFIHSEMKNCPFDVLRPPAIPQQELLSLQSTAKIPGNLLCLNRKLQVSFVNLVWAGTVSCLGFSIWSIPKCLRSTVLSSVNKTKTNLIACSTDSNFTTGWVTVIWKCSCMSRFQWSVVKFNNIIWKMEASTGKSKSILTKPS